MEYIAHDYLVQMVFLFALAAIIIAIYTTRSDRFKKKEEHEQEIDTLRVRRELDSEPNLPVPRKYPSEGF